MSSFPIHDFITHVKSIYHMVVFYFHSQRSSDGIIDPSQETTAVYPGQRAEDATCHTNHVLRKNKNSPEDPNNITAKKVGRWVRNGDGHDLAKAVHICPIDVSGRIKQALVVLP